MAHKTMVGGTSYEMQSGRFLLDGTGYDVDHGRTLIGGTGYDIGFALPPLNDCTWEQIRAASDDGKAANYWAVGDIKSIVIDGTVGTTTFSNLSIDIFILGFDHNSDIEGANKIHFSIGRISGVDVALVGNNYGGSTSSAGRFNMNTRNSNSGGWEECSMRSNILGSDSDPANPTANTLLAALPSDLRAVMKAITKYTDNKGGTSSIKSYVTATEDYLPLMSTYEVNGYIGYANTYEKNYQARYAYYAEGNGVERYKHSATTTLVVQWLRSPHKGYSYTFMLLNPTSSSASISADYIWGIAPILAV